jgi:hypothetical protein
MVKDFDPHEYQTPICVQCEHYSYSKVSGHTCTALEVVDYVTGVKRENKVDCYHRNQHGNCGFFKAAKFSPNEDPS